MTTIESRACLVWLDKEGVAHATIKEGIDMTRVDAEEAIRALEELSAGVPVPVVVDMRRLRSIDRAARRFFAGPETARAQRAAALLVDSPLTRTVGNFFLALDKPLVPTRLFSEEDEAIAWLRQH